MAKLVDNTFSTRKEIKDFEIVADSVSDSYVPIYTTEIVDILQPEFELVGGSRLYASTSAHFVDFKKDNETIRIYNSYDRELALRASLVSDDFIVDLGIDKLVHRGERAKGMIDELKEFKPEILKSIKTAKTIRAKFDTQVIDKNIAKEISDLIFIKHTRKDGFQEYTNYADILIDKNISIKTYITTSINKYLKGEYTVTNNGKKRLGKATNATFFKVKLQNRIVRYLKANFPEYFL